MPAREVRPEEDALVEAARAGDQGAFTELVRRHQHEVYTLALRLVADREMAADIAQEAFVRAWRAMPRFRGEARFSTWLHRITVNTAWTHRKRALRHSAEPLHEMFREPEATDVSPERAGESAELGARLDESLAELSPNTRVVVVLKDVYGWSHGEIAEHLGITVTAAKVRLHRGRKQLRLLLWPHKGEPS